MPVTRTAAPRVRRCSPPLASLAAVGLARHCLTRSPRSPRSPLIPGSARQVKDILPALQRLRANESHAEAIASAGRRVALEALSHVRVLAYFRLLLEQISRRQPEPPRLAEGFSRIETP